MGMRLEEIEFRRFGAFEVQHVPLGRELTLLIGDNGSGKSSILHGCAWALGGFVGGLPGVRGRNLRKGERRKVLANADEWHLPDRGETSVRVRVRLAGEEMAWTRTSGRSYASARYGDVLPLRGDGREAASWLADAVARDGATKLPLIAFYDTSRLYRPPRKGATVSAHDTNPRFRGYHDALETHSVGARVLGAIGRALDPLAREPGWPQRARGDVDLGKGIMASLEGVIPEVDGWAIEPGDPSEILVRFRGSWIAFESLSDGYRNLLMLLGDLAWRALLLNPARGLDALREVEGVVLVDELDLHMHPTWQRRIIAQIRTLVPRVQLIGTTHSPFIIQAADLPAGSRVINLQTKESPAPHGMGIEDIAENLQGVDMPQKSSRRAALEEVALRYYTALDGGASPAEIAALEDELDRLSEPYGDDPAFTAFNRFVKATRGHG